MGPVIALTLCLLVLMNITLAGKAPLVELSDGNKIPIVALGTGRGSADKFPVEGVRNAVFWAIEAGYRHVDTAWFYKNELQVGKGVADAIAKGLVTREDMFITTKLWNDRHARDQVVPALKDSLNNLAMDYVDLFLIHMPIPIKPDGSPGDIDYLETWKGMEDAKELGLAKSIGVANFNASQIDRILANCKVKPAVNQAEVHPAMTSEALVDHCKSRGIAVMAFSPFGFLVPRHRKGLSASPPPSFDNPTLVKIAQKYGKTTGQIVLRYTIDRGALPIPQSINKDRIAQNIDLFDFKLSDDEIATISSFNQNISVFDYLRWKNYPYFPYEHNVH